MGYMPKLEKGMVMRICDLPYYDKDGNNDMDKEYVKEFRQIIKSRNHATILKRLRKHIIRWKALWEVGQDIYRFPNLLKLIAKGAIQRHQIKRIKQVGNTNFIPREGDEIVMCLILPPAMIRARMAAIYNMVPFTVALHQLYCKEEDHTECY